MKNFHLFVLLGLLLAKSASASDDGWVDWDSQTPEADAAPTKPKPQDASGPNTKTKTPPSAQASQKPSATQAAQPSKPEQSPQPVPPQAPAAPDQATQVPQQSPGQKPSTPKLPPAKDQPWSPWPTALIGAGCATGGACVGLGLGFIPVVALGLETAGDGALMSFPLLGFGASVGALIGAAVPTLVSGEHYNCLPQVGMTLAPTCAAGLGGCAAGAMGAVLGVIMGNVMDSLEGGVGGAVIGVSSGALLTIVLTAGSYTALAVWLAKESEEKLSLDSTQQQPRLRQTEGLTLASEPIQTQTPSRPSQASAAMVHLVAMPY